MFSMKQMHFKYITFLARDDAVAVLETNCMPLFTEDLSLQ